jgi:hypothetical protein
MINISLSEQDAELFKRFRKYQDIWERVFKIKGGSVTFHFDDSGILRETEYKYKNKIKLERA